METIEITGKSVKDATEAAAKQMGTSADSLTVTVLEQHKGLFGKASVRIRAEVAAQKAPAAAPVETLAAVESEAPEAPEAPAKKPSRGRKPAPAKEAKATETEHEEPHATASENGHAGPREEATEEDAANSLKILEDVLKSGDLEVTAKVTGVSGRYVSIELDGKDVAYLVGKHGEVLNALQYVINIISNQQHGNGIRATLDGNNYRHRREEALTTLATRIADQVKERGEEAVLDALPAFERRIVHKALSDYEGVTTYSEGEEPGRRVVIAPID